MNVYECVNLCENFYTEVTVVNAGNSFHRDQLSLSLRHRRLAVGDK